MKRLALCIGNDDYSILDKLDCAVADAVAIESTLKQLGFDTILKTNLDRSGLNSAIIDAIDKIEGYDAFLLYFAGHGFQVGGDNVLAPIDLSVEAQELVIKHDSFPVNDLLDCLKAYPSKPKILILDACRKSAGFRGTSPSFAPVLAPQGTIIAYATSPGQGAKENKSAGHGYYTEALLKYMPLPRVPIETIFKKVREYLFAKTQGTQIPWEHTSLVGDFYLCPDTIYDGVRYSPDALADADMKFLPSSAIKPIIDGLKSYDWYTQSPAISKVASLSFHECSANELFVLGRNIYQAADGGSWDAQAFIDNFVTNNKIPIQGKIHMLAGMAYEIYYDSHNQLRTSFKCGYYEAVLRLIEHKEFFSCREFISSLLCKISDKPIYIPGQNEMVELIINIEKHDEELCLIDIIYQGHSVLYDVHGVGKITTEGWNTAKKLYSFKAELAAMIVAPKDMLRITWGTYQPDKEDVIGIPCDGISLRYNAVKNENPTDYLPF